MSAAVVEDSSSVSASECAIDLSTKGEAACIEEKNETTDENANFITGSNDDIAVSKEMKVNQPDDSVEVEVDDVLNIKSVEKLKDYLQRNNGKDDANVVDDKLDQISLGNETELVKHGKDVDVNGGVLSSGLEGVSDISDGPLTDATTNKDENSAAAEMTQSPGGGKKKKLRVRTSSHFSATSSRNRTERSSTSDNNHHQYRGYQPKNYNRRLQMNNYNNRSFYPPHQSHHSFNQAAWSHPRYDYDLNYKLTNRRYNNEQYHGYPMGRYQNGGPTYTQGPSRYNRPEAREDLGNHRFGHNQSFSGPLHSAMYVNGRNGNMQPESDRYDEVVKSINYNDNGKVININASLAPSAAAKLKETSSYHLRVRLPATTPLSVVKRILCAKFFLTKMMSVAKYSVGKQLHLPSNLNQMSSYHFL